MLTLLNKLALRNAKRSIKDYMIYLITVTLSFSFIFAFNLISFSKDVLNLSSMMVNFKYSMYFVNGLIIFVICFLINYTTKFIFKKRSKEFGTYLILGIKKKQITSLFTRENIILGSCSFVLSIPLGYLFSMIMSYIMMTIFELPKLIKINITIRALGLTFLYFLLIYFIVLLLLRKRFKKLKIHDLLYLERKNEKRRKQSIVTSCLFLCFFLAIGFYALFVFDKQFAGINVEPSMVKIFQSILMIIISIYGTTLTIPNILIYLVLKSKKIKYHQDNLFVVRLFSSKIKTMSFTLGTLTVLITLTLVALNISSLFKGMFEYQIKQNAPYDISINVINTENVAKYLAKIEEDYTIKDQYIHHSYQDSQNNIRKKLENDVYLWHQQDIVIKLSDYNKLMALKNEKPLELRDDEYLINCSKEACEKIKESNMTSFETKKGTFLTLKEITNQGFDYNITGFSYFAVLKDEYVEEIIIDTFLTVNTLEKTKEQFAETLASMEDSENCRLEDNYYICYTSSKIAVKGKEEANNKSFMTITSFICFYIAFIFTAVVGTILAILALSESCEYKYRYTVLKRLGYKESDCYKSIRKQLLLFFLFPLIIPCLVSFTTIHSMNKLFQIVLTSNNEYFHYFLASFLLFLAIYSLYLITTYFGYKKNIEE
jgi:putative ABC transport system permease protein